MTVDTNTKKIKINDLFLSTAEVKKCFNFNYKEILGQRNKEVWKSCWLRLGGLDLSRHFQKARIESEEIELEIS